MYMKTLFLKRLMFIFLLFSMLFKRSVSEVLALSKRDNYIDSDCKGNVEEESA